MCTCFSCSLRLSSLSRLAHLTRVYSFFFSSDSPGSSGAHSALEAWSLSRRYQPKKGLGLPPKKGCKFVPRFKGPIGSYSREFSPVARVWSTPMVFGGFRWLTLYLFLKWADPKTDIDPEIRLARLQLGLHQILPSQRRGTVDAMWHRLHRF